MTDQPLVTCANCTHKTTAHNKLCAVWNEKTLQPITRGEMRDLFHDELGGISFSNVDMPRLCQHFTTEDCL